MSIFAGSFLSEFTLNVSQLPFVDAELLSFDKKLGEYEKVFLNPDIESNLISKNELLASFAISKAENSALTLQEARSVYDLVVANKGLTFLSEKLKSGQKLITRDFEKLEFYNIAKVFRSQSQKILKINDLTPSFIKNTHKELTAGFDIFKNYLSNFTVYKSGIFRDNDEIRVGTCVPAPYREIEGGVEELLSWISKNQNITSIGVFHTALYGLHPFNNGNKRVCRILEHLLLRSIGLNKKNLYSTSYYYHKEKSRYYKYLLASIERKNLGHFVSFFQEALFYSMVDTVATSLEVKRADFVEQQDVNSAFKAIVKPLYKRREVQYKNLWKLSRKKMAEQTFVNYLQQGLEKEILSKRESGRAVYYKLNKTFEEEKTINDWLLGAKGKLSYVPESLIILEMTS